MRPSEKSEAKTAGQKGSEAWFAPRRERFWPTTQASGFAAGRNRAGYLDRLLVLVFRYNILLLLRRRLKFFKFSFDIKSDNVIICNTWPQFPGG